VILVMLLGQSRVFYSMSRDGLLGGWASKVHPKFRTPYVSTIFTGIAVGIAFVPAPIPVLGIPNPFGREELRAETLGLVGIGFVLLGLTSLLCVVSLLLRYRRSSGVEHQQIKWVAFAGIVGVWPGVLVLVLGLPLGVGALIASFSAVPLPTAMTIALIRYRLYDIDLLIKRTVVYGATSAAIALTFFAGILALQALLRPVTSGSELAIAASTLLSFALFQPIRRRVQEGVDRRFDRSRYSAARTLDAFAEQLRDEVDLDALRGDLIAAVERTMAPAHASVWLRSGGAGSRNDFRTADG